MINSISLGICWPLAILSGSYEGSPPRKRREVHVSSQISVGSTTGLFSERSTIILPLRSKLGGARGTQTLDFFHAMEAL